MIASLHSVIAVLRDHNYSEDTAMMEQLASVVASDDAAAVVNAAEEIRGRCHVRDLGDTLITTISYSEWHRLLEKLATDMTALITQTLAHDA
jgi:hypothetical protein